MICAKCVNWQCGPLRYEELLERWESSIGGRLTPGHIKRYKKKAEQLETPFEEVHIDYKYCSAGVLSRFYLMKTDGDVRPVRDYKECPKFTDSDVRFQPLSPLYSICAYESHGLTTVDGINFVPGLYENQTYMRIPLYGTVQPKVVRDEEPCSVCGHFSQRSIRLRFEKSFCCNEYYIKWWAKRYREEATRLG